MWQKEEVIHKLQGSGRRVTRQREMLLEIILDGSWSSCKEIYYEAAKRDPSIGLATEGMAPFHSHCVCRHYHNLS